MRRAILCTTLTLGLLALPRAAAADDTPPPAAAPTPTTDTPSPAPAAPAAPAPATLPAPTPPRAPRLATATPPPGSIPPIPTPPADPLMEISAAGFVISFFAIVVLVACAAGSSGSVETRCLESSGLTVLGGLAVGIPFMAIARQQTYAAVPYVDRVRFAASAHGGSLGWSGAF